MRKFLLLLSLIGLSLVIVACSNDDQAEEDNNSNNTETETETPNTDEEVAVEEAVDEDTVVAKVNGTEITGNKYNAMYAQTKVMFEQYGQDTSDVELLKEQTLNSLIEQELLNQEVQEKGIEVDNAEVDENIEQIRGQFETEEEYQEQLAQLHFTEESLREQLLYELRMTQYIDQELTIEVTDQEVEEFYEELSAQQGEETPPLEEVEQQIKDQLASQERTEAITTIIADLKEESEIETLI